MGSLKADGEGKGSMLSLNNLANTAKKISGYKEPVKTSSPVMSGTAKLTDEEYKRTTGRQRSSTLLGG